MLKKILTGAVAAVLTLGTVSCSGVAPTETSKTVTFFTMPGWDDVNGATALWTVLLEEKKALTIKNTTVDLAAGFTGVAKGSLDGFIGVWLPNAHESYISKYKEDLVILNENGGGYYDNDSFVLAVPDYSPAKTIQDLAADPAAYGNEIIGIEPGTGLMKSTPTTLEANGVSGDYKIVESSTSAMLASLDSAIKNKKNVVVTLWRPHWAFSQMPIRALEDTGKGWPQKDHSYITVSKKFAQEHADVAKWMSNMKLTDAEYESLMFEVSQSDNPIDAAKKWLEDKDHRATAESWFN